MKILKLPEPTPITSGANSNSEPEPIRATLTRLREWITAPLEPEQIPTARALLKALRIPAAAASSLNQTTFRNISYIVNKQKCDTCNGAIPNCKRLIAKYENGEIIIYDEACQKSIEFAKSTKARKLIERANVPNIFRNVRADAFDTNGRGSKNQLAMDLAEDAIFNDTSLYIYGECGTGKTLLASIIANERAFEGKHSAFVNVPDILEDLRDFNQSTKFADSLTRQDKLNFFYRADCLIVDDLGAEKPSDWTCETLFKIINRRYNDGKQIIITSNFNIDELSRHMHYTAGDRIVRRICDMCKPVQIV